MAANDPADVSGGGVSGGGVSSPNRDDRSESRDGRVWSLLDGDILDGCLESVLIIVQRSSVIAIRVFLYREEQR